MKQIFIISLIMLNIIVSPGQSIVTTNKSWDNHIRYYSPNPIPVFGTEHIRFTNDTLIGSLTYKKVERSVDVAQLNWAGYGFIRENEIKQVFYKINANDVDRMLYNMEVNIHDSVIAYDLSTSYGSRNLVSIKYYVNSIDSMLIGQTFRKRINLGWSPGNPLDFSEQWVDSTGSISGMLHNSWMFVGGDVYELGCFTEDGILQYQNPEYSTCFFGTGIGEINTMNAVVSVCPNPITNISSINIDGIKDMNEILFRLYTLLGKEVLLKTGETKIEIHEHDFPSGIYIYQLTDNQQIFLTGKLIIN